MKCRFPLRTLSGVHSCGQCMPCRIFRRERWVLRMCLELASNNDARFVTFTYEDNPEVLIYEDMQDMWKRLRASFKGRLRFFCVGEYGSLKLRPHWHAILYSDMVCPKKSALEDAWQKGFVDVDKRPVTASACRYVGKYITKDVRTDGENIVRMSLRDGIGCRELFRLGEDFGQQGYNIVPGYLLYGGKRFYLDTTAKRWFSKGVEEAGLLPVAASSVFDAEKAADNLALLVRRGFERTDPFFVRLVKHGKKAEASRWFYRPTAAQRASRCS